MTPAASSRNASAVSARRVASIAAARRSVRRLRSEIARQIIRALML